MKWSDTLEEYETLNQYQAEGAKDAPKELSAREIVAKVEKSVARHIKNMSCKTIRELEAIDSEM